MRILILHNRYIQRGGEDSVVEAEGRLLRDGGHQVRLLERDNKALEGRSRLGLALEAFWSFRACAELRETIRDFRPDVMHVHNFFPQFSPAVFWTAKAEGVACVMTLHNFRYGCPGGLLFRQGHVCRDCVGRLPLPGVLHRCYRDSFAQSLVNAGSFMLHRAMGTFQGKIDRYITLCQSSSRIFIQMGLPAARLMDKPNFVDLPGPDPEQPRRGGLFVGRLSAEKGLGVLAEALKLLPELDMAVIGSGPEEAALMAAPRARVLGWQQPEMIYAHMRQAAYLVFPSLWHEHFPRTIVEAYACGLPIIASRLGAMAELVEEGRTGLLFEPGSAQELAEKLRWAEAHPQEMRRMGQAARRLFEDKYTPEKNLERLLAIYAAARAGRPGDAG